MSAEAEDEDPSAAQLDKHHSTVHERIREALAAISEPLLKLREDLHGDEHQSPVDKRIKEFLADFSIKSYLKLREDFPGVDIPVRRLTGLEFITPLAGRLKHLGIDGMTIASVMDADPDCIERVALVLLRELDRERDLAQQGKTHLQVNGVTPLTSTYLAFICVCFEAMELNDAAESIPALNFLLQQVLMPGMTDLQEQVRQQELRNEVLIRAVHIYSERGKPPSQREMAKLLGVAPSTVSRMFKGAEEYARLVKGLAPGSALLDRIWAEVIREQVKAREQGS